MRPNPTTEIKRRQKEQKKKKKEREEKRKREKAKWDRQCKNMIFSRPAENPFKAPWRNAECFGEIDTTRLAASMSRRRSAVSWPAVLSMQQRHRLPGETLLHEIHHLLLVLD